MYDKLTTSTLKTGESLEIGVVLPPDEMYEPLVKPFLGHKPQQFEWHIEKAFIPGAIKGLETRFYLGQVDQKPICNIMTVEYKGIGILGHVYTAADMRRKGACKLVMKVQMQDFLDRDGRYLTLGTGFNTPPYWIYHSFGFRSFQQESGFMFYKTEENFESRHFSSAPTTITSPTWQDWPLLNVLCARSGKPYLRNMAFGHFGPSNFEGGYLSFLRGFQSDTDEKNNARILKSGDIAIAGYIMIQPDRNWKGQTCLLDLDIHPDFLSHTRSLFEALPIPNGIKIQCYTEEDTDWKIDALLEAGFKLEATLRSQIVHENRAMNLEIYSRM